MPADSRTIYIYSHKNIQLAFEKNISMIRAGFHCYLYWHFNFYVLIMFRISFISLLLLIIKQTYQKSLLPNLALQTNANMEVKICLL